MRRRIAPCACVLALVTGAWFGQAYPLVAPPESMGSVDAPSQGATAAARRYYEAIDLMLRTGDAAPLRESVSPHLVDHVETLDERAGRDGFLQSVAALRASHPALRLVPYDLLAQDDRAVARITLGGATGTVLGIPIGGAAPWPEVEIVRIDAGRIVERWGDVTGLALATPLFSEPLTVPLDGAAPHLRRITFAPAPSPATFDQIGPAIVAVESGTLEVGTDVRPDPASPWASRRIGPGETVVVPEHRTFAAHNPTGSPATMLVLSLAPTVAKPRQRLATQPDASDRTITVHTLAGAGAVIVPAGGEVVAELARITLTPGAHLSPHPIGGAEFVVIEDGALSVTADGASFTARLRDPRGESAIPGQYAVMAEGDGLSISGRADPNGNALTSYRNESDLPVTFQLLRIGPAPGKRP